MTTADEEALQALMRQYDQDRATLSESARAAREHAIWEIRKRLWGPGGTKRNEKRDWFHSRYGGAVSDYDLRAQLFNYGTWVAPLWEQVDAGLKLRTAIHLARVARETARTTGADLEKTLKETIAEYGTRGQKMLNESPVREEEPESTEPEEEYDEPVPDTDPSPVMGTKSERQAKFDALVAAYKVERESLKPSEKAARENEIWRLMKSLIGPGISKDYERRDWLQAEFGGTVNEYDLRALLMNQGAWVKPLWDRVDNGMPLNTARKLLWETKRLMAKTGQSSQAALAKVLEDYGKSGHTRVTKEGKTFQSRAPYSKPPPIGEAVRGPADFISRVSQLVDELATVSCETLDEYLVEELKRDLMEWIRQGYDEFRSKATAHRAREKRDKLMKIGVTRFRQACEVLGLKGNFGKPLDQKQLRKCYVTRVAPLHPDKNNGSHARQQEYEAVVDAYRLLSDYQKQLEE